MTAPLHTLQDGFDQPTSLWQYGAGAVADRGQLTIRPDLNPDVGRTEGTVRSAVAYDLRGSFLVVELTHAAHSIMHSTGLGAFTDDPWSNAVLWEVWDDGNAGTPSGQTLRALARVAGGDLLLATFPYDPDLHRWLRLRESAGAVYWDSSPDGFTWTTRTGWSSALDLSSVRAWVGVWNGSPQEPLDSSVVEQVNLVTGLDDPTTLTGAPGEPYLAVDVVPDNLTGTFQLDSSVLDGLDELAWSTDAPGAWRNIVCDVTAVSYQRGATREQGALTQTEAGTCTVTLTDPLRSFDPLTNADAIHRSTPLRLRAWGYADALETLEVRRNLVPNPAVRTSAAGWLQLIPAGSVGSATVARSTATGVTANGQSLTAFTRCTWQTSPPVGVGGAGCWGTAQYGHPIPAAYGDTLSAACYARPSVAQRMAAVLIFHDYTGAELSRVTGPEVVATAAAWRRFTVTGAVAPPATSYVSVGVTAVTGASAVAWPAASTLDVTGAQVEKGTTVGLYFDGARPAAAGMAYSWLGMANDSPSLETTQATTTQRWDAVLFTGVVDEVLVQYRKTDAPTVTVTGLDLVGELAAWKATGRGGDGVGAGDTLAQRVQRTLAEVGRGELSGDSDASGYQAALAPAQLANPWQELTDATEAELGSLWVDNRNRLVARARGSQPSGTVRGTLSDVHGEAPLGAHCCVADASVVYGVESMANRTIGARRKRPSEPAETVAAVAQRDDAYSQRRYGVATVERQQLMLQTDADAARWAEALIVRHTYPELRVDSVDPLPSPVDLNSALQAWPAVLQTDLGDRWLFRYHPEVGPVVDRGLGVLGIRLDATPAGWSITWTTQEAPAPGRMNPSGWFTLDVSQLDSGDVLSPFSLSTT